MNPQNVPPDIGNPYASPNPDLVPPLELSHDWTMPPLDLANAIRMGGTIIWEDYREALRLHARVKNEVSRIATLIGLLLTLGLVGYWILQDWRFIIAPLILCLFLFCLFLFSGALPRYTARWSWDRSVRIRDPFARTITLELIQTTCPSSMSLTRWSAFLLFKRSETMLLLYNDALGPLHLFPRRLFKSDADWQRFIELVERNVRAG